MFFDKFIDLCNSRNISPSAAAIEIGFSNAAAAGWKKGARPRQAAIKKIADYFGVSPDYFDEGTSENNKEDPAAAGEAFDITQYWNLLSRENQAYLKSEIAEKLKEQLQG